MDKTQAKQPIISIVEKTINIEQLKKNAGKNQAKKLNTSIRQFCNYAHATVGLYISPDDVILLDQYIECYVRGESLPTDFTRLTTAKLANADLFHFGWNMWKHFKVSKQGDVAIWLRNIFYNLSDCELSYIVGKLTVSEHTNYLIPLTEDIEEYMAELNL